MFVEYDFIDGVELEKVLLELNDYTEDLPWVLLDYIDKMSYFNRISDDVKVLFFNRKHNIQRVDDFIGFLKYDFQKWIDENPKYNNLFKKED